MKKAILCWSGGKDSAYCLHKVLQAREFDVCYLLTTLSRPQNRISMHGVREELLDAQAKALNLPLLKVFVSQGTNEEYEEQMANTLKKAQAEGINHVIFGDIFLEDLRAYREKNLARIGMKAVFPIWKMDTRQVVQDFIQSGFRSVVCCVSDAYLNESHLGRVIDQTFLDELPKAVDPCGENGEFHTFCFDGPIYDRSIAVDVAEKIYKPLTIKMDNDHPDIKGPKTEGFWFCELKPQ